MAPTSTRPCQIQIRNAGDVLIALTGGDISWEEQGRKSRRLRLEQDKRSSAPLSGVFSEEPQWVT